MKAQDLQKGKIYKSTKNVSNTYMFDCKLRKDEYVFTQFENGEYVGTCRLNEKQISYLSE